MGNTIICLDESQKIRNLVQPLIIKTIQEMAAETENQKLLPHRNNFYTIFWVQQGEGTYLIDFVKHTIQPNTIYFLGQEQIHHPQLHPQTQGFVVLFNEDFLIQSGLYIEFINHLSCFDRYDAVKPLQIGEDTAKLFHQLVKALQRETQKDDEFTVEIAGTLLKLFFLGCKRLYQQHDDTIMTLLGDNRAVSIVQEFKTLVNLHFSTNHKVSEYADMMNLTASYLNQTIKQEAGFTPKDYIVQRIMLEAKKKALLTDLSAKDIANSLGFDDPAHFSKLFKNTENLNFSNFKDSYLATL
jgi:AraC family transcriptional activator of pobA